MDFYSNELPNLLDNIGNILRELSTRDNYEGLGFDWLGINNLENWDGEAT